MTKILVIMLARGVGGLERRTATMYRYLTRHPTGCRITFLVNRAQVALLQQHYRYMDQTGCCRLVTFGLPYQGIFKKSDNLSYIIDYSFLLVALLRLRLYNHFDIAYFTKFSSLPLRHVVPSKHNILALVDSHTTSRIVDSRIFDKILNESFTIDCLSRDLRSIVLNRKKIPPDQVHATPCSFIDYSNTEIGEKAKIVTFCGRLAAGKGLDLLLPVIPELLEAHPDLTIHVLGDGPLLPEVEKAVQNLNSECFTVQFATDPASFLKNSLIFLSLQEKENYPSQSLLEAMACGNAVIATDVGLTRKLVNEQVGLLIPSDQNRLLDAIHQLLRNPARTAQMGKNARKTVLAVHTVEKYINYFTHELIPASGKSEY